MKKIKNTIKILIKHLKEIEILKDGNINNAALAEFMSMYNHIPVPAHNYNHFCDLYRGRDDFKTILSAVVAHCSIEYIIFGKDPQKVTGNLEIEMINLWVPAAIILDYFDLDHPILDDDGKYYIFSFKDSVMAQFTGGDINE